MFWLFNLHFSYFFFEGPESISKMSGLDEDNHSNEPSKNATTDMIVIIFQPVKLAIISTVAVISLLAV